MCFISPPSFDEKIVYLLSIVCDLPNWCFTYVMIGDDYDDDDDVYVDADDEIVCM